MTEEQIRIEVLKIATGNGSVPLFPDSQEYLDRLYAYITKGNLK